MNGTSPHVRFATLDDVSVIQDFIGAYWQRDHVFVKDARLLLWQHRDGETSRLNFVIVEDSASRSLLGLLGFIPTSHFDRGLETEGYLWLALWKMRDDVQLPGVGMQLLFFLLGEKKPRSLMVIGLTPKALAIYRSLRFDTGTMTHYFHLNPTLSEYRIAAITRSTPSLEMPNDPSLRIAAVTPENISELDELFSAYVAVRPKKTPAFFINRYLRHPVYRYSMQAVWRGSRVVGCWLNRAISRPEGRVIRGVDCIFNPNGDPSWMRPSIARLVQEHGAEYWDFYAAGRCAEILNNAGFARREGDEIIIPNYFEPFVRKNIDILYAYWSPAGHQLSCVKGDADQDRPSLLDTWRQ